jgi:hypothetical protein
MRTLQMIVVTDIGKNIQEMLKVKNLQIYYE